MSLLPLVTGLLDLGIYVQCPTNLRILLANLFPPSKANLSARHLHGRVPSKKPHARLNFRL
jgi:hypothetical protein